MGIDPKVVDKLRRNQSLRELSDGREGVDVTLQFLGSVPAQSRPEPKDWLKTRFSNVKARIDARLDLKPESLSVSAQSIDATVPVDDFDDIQEKLSQEGVRVNVTQTVKVVDR
jgi:hypothetical protein